MYVEGDPVNLADPGGDNPIMAAFLNSGICLSGVSSLVNQLVPPCSCRLIGLTLICDLCDLPLPNPSIPDLDYPGDFLRDLIRFLFPTVLLADIITDTATDTDKDEDTCDPAAFVEWWFTLPPRGGIRIGAPDYDYEQRLCRYYGAMGDYAREVPAGSEYINADGADPNTCRLLECKHSETPERPRLRTGGHPGSVFDFDDEVRRYRLAVTVQNGVPGAQPQGLEVLTNAPLTRDHAETVLAQRGFAIGIDGFALLTP